MYTKSVYFLSTSQAAFVKRHRLAKAVKMLRANYPKGTSLAVLITIVRKVRSGDYDPLCNGAAVSINLSA